MASRKTSSRNTPQALAEWEKGSKGTGRNSWTGGGW